MGIKIVTGVAVIFCVLMLAEGSAYAELIVGYAPDADEIKLVDTEVDKDMPAGFPDDQVVYNGITFNLYYLDLQNNTNVGFDNDASTGPKAQARFKETLQYVASVINETGTLDVVVNESQTDGSGFLAAAGTYFSNTPGFQMGSTMSRLKNDIKPFNGYEEVYLTVDFGWNWYLDKGTPGFSQPDFLTVLLHEMTHSLGLISLCSNTGDSVVAPNVYSMWDKEVVRRTGMFNLFVGTPPEFTGALFDLTGQNLAFAGSEAFLRYGHGLAPGVYAPSTWQSGSSISHWDTGNIIGGAVMEHLVVTGTTRREWSPVDIGALVDLGYTNIDPMEVEGE
ncbi:MAG TPA: hypothetical protein PLI09_22515, partial [Candidatus Hydrogenedentes bacterium]|nr:hypothetical protein [Candidatus Hydrogenedentota bacterium]